MVNQSDILTLLKVQTANDCVVIDVNYNMESDSYIVDINNLEGQPKKFEFWLTDEDTPQAVLDTFNKAVRDYIQQLADSRK